MKKHIEWVKRLAGTLQRRPVTGRRQFLRGFATATATVAFLGVTRLQLAEGEGWEELPTTTSGSGQVWAVGRDGGYMYSEDLTRELREALQPILRFRTFADTA